MSEDETSYGLTIRHLNAGTKNEIFMLWDDDNDRGIGLGSTINDALRVYADYLRKTYDV